MSPAHHRVAVIGGGIAGSAACLRLTDLAVQPLWIAITDGGRDKPGEQLSPAARPLLKQIGALDLLDKTYHRAANAMFSAWGSDQIAERNAMVHLEGPGTVIDRTALEQDLSNVVLDRGVERIQTKLTKASWHNEYWLLELDNASVKADYLIDASGRHAIIAKQQAPRFRADQLLAAVAYLEQSPNSEVDPTHATLIEAVADGWWYATLLADGRLALNYYTDSDLLPSDISRQTEVILHALKNTQYIGRWIEEADFLLKAPPNLASVGTTWIAPAAGKGWIAVGDAAAAFDPLSSHGMTTALWTAITGADAAIAYLDGNQEPSQNYTKKVATGIQEFLNSRAAIYGLETRFNDQEFWRRRQLCPLASRM